ncbi:MULTISPECIES: phasin family protein [unclassified Candidatus Frackibacter]|uniref:phasin family protein n=1 Tax=unclassified Candidatus Frackibacter TaxID=2648818 RepID=UPI000796000F|nr:MULTISPECIES: hypothetical protein [unclassified Candidatus Frackibacter]KXS44185.1 MAG: hypothetical protein AWU54_806 [Candidatus Frackibacter sp. T328-2]SDC64315.1 Polyhydroxyalkanoate synthesis regulator phasin [Candidatus Frackibacter sp. WG11]SEM77593.1 Polyhydroxyalkanoate synthesis regulator phasin [Candidatus Frackibacter sp. WG12]SFL88506.1 Polyhydroxyalkanoate synthesis regulator phasin [Candidatus Frackibacter sp. WG13]
MFELFKKTLATGLGAMLFTKEKAEELVEELVEQGRLNREEAEVIIDDLMEMFEKERDETKDKVKKEFEELLEKAGLKRDNEIDNLKDKVRNLELEIVALREEIEGLKEGENEDSELISEVND